MAFEPRIYRGRMNSERFRFFNLVNKETDLWIGISPGSLYSGLLSFCEERIGIYRYELEHYIEEYPLFGSSFTPIPSAGNIPDIAAEMSAAATNAGTGPMAAVAGAFAEFVGNDIIQKYHPEELVIENGGYIFVSNKDDLLVQFFAGGNQNFKSLAIQIPARYNSLGICTSSGTFGHSFSYGKADSVTVVCKSATLADAWATSICNRIQSGDDIKPVIESLQEIQEILSLVIIKDDEMGVTGEFMLNYI